MDPVDDLQDEAALCVASTCKQLQINYKSCSIHKKNGAGVEKRHEHLARPLLRAKKNSHAQAVGLLLYFGA
jgi:hypothetical protein